MTAAAGEVMTAEAGEVMTAEAGEVMTAEAGEVMTWRAYSSSAGSSDERVSTFSCSSGPTLTKA